MFVGYTAADIWTTRTRIYGEGRNVRREKNKYGPRQTHNRRREIVPTMYSILTVDE